MLFRSVAVLDFDGDGWEDLFFANGAPQPSLRKRVPEDCNRLYRNRGDGTFADVTAESGLCGSGYDMGAAVGDFQVPCAFGTQTGGSHIRPASFNGIYALKPTWGAVSREGARMSSMTLDTVGWYGRSVDDLSLVAGAFRIAEHPHPIDVRGLKVGVCRSPVWNAIEPSGALALDTAAKRLADAGAVVMDLELPEPFSRLHDAHTEIGRAHV